MMLPVLARRSQPSSTISKDSIALTRWSCSEVGYCSGTSCGKAGSWAFPSPPYNNNALPSAILQGRLVDFPIDITGLYPATAIPANAFCTLAVSIRSRRAGVSRSVGEAILSGSVADVSFGYRGVPEEPFLAHPGAAWSQEVSYSTSSLRCPNASARYNVSQSGMNSCRNSARSCSQK